MPPSFAGAMVGLGEGITVGGKMLGEYFRSSALQKEAGEITAMRDQTLAELQGKRDDRLHAQAVTMEKDVRQPFQTSERVAGQAFQEGQQTRGFKHAEGMQDRGFEHAEGMQDAQQTFQAEQNAAQRTLTREQIASQERISRANNAISLQVAQMGGTVQQDKDGNFLFVDRQGNTKPVLDPNNPGQPLKGLKDLSPAAKAYVDTIKAQLVDLDRMEIAAAGDQAQLASISKRRSDLTAQQLNVLTGGISEAGKSTTTPGSAPAVGTVVEGFKFKGGNPRDRSNWEPAGNSNAQPSRGLVGRTQAGESSAPQGPIDYSPPAPGVGLPGIIGDAIDSAKSSQQEGRTRYLTDRARARILTPSEVTEARQLGIIR